MNKDRYYKINSKPLAITLGYFLGREFYVYDDETTYSGKRYIFKDDEKFRQALNFIMNNRNNFK